MVKQLELKWLEYGRKLIGTTEIKGAKHNETVLALWQSAFEATDQPIPAVFKNDETAWCGGFVGFVMANVGLTQHIPSAFPMARAWATAGTKLEKPAYGCVVVFTRSGGGHVGFVVGKDKFGNLMVLGGNQSDKVSIVPFAKTRAIAYRWCGTQELPNPIRYDLPLLTSSGKVSKNEA